MNAVAAALPRVHRPRGTGWLTRIGLAALGLAVLVGLWASVTAWLRSTTPLAAMLAPGATFHALYELLASGQLDDDIAVSLKRVLVSLVASLVLGVPIGIAVGASRRLDQATGSAFQFLRMISPLSWMPIAVMAFGIGNEPIYFLLTITAIWPIVLATAAGVRALDPHWLMLAKSLGANRRETLWHVVIPGILGHILTGVRVAIGMIWILLIPCEMLGVSSGLGYFILDTRDRLAYSELMAVILVIGFLGLLLDGAAQCLRHWLGGDGNPA
ncbi:MAG TPA: ABC transporter permease [Rhodanobacteraceae bacterium]